MTNISTKEAHLFENDYHLLGDFFDFFCGKFIGEGQYRVVYQYNINPKWVVKIAKCKSGIGRFDNIVEWDMYGNIEVKYPKLLKYLAKPLYISSCGRVMIMEKTIPLEYEDELPKRVPAFLTDICTRNWGKIGDRVVCHDYGNHNLYKTMNTKLVTRH